MCDAITERYADAMGVPVEVEARVLHIQDGGMGTVVELRDHTASRLDWDEAGVQYDGEPGVWYSPTNHLVVWGS
jgi:hypothetical protein